MEVKIPGILHESLSSLFMNGLCKHSEDDYIRSWYEGLYGDEEFASMLYPGEDEDFSYYHISYYMNYENPSDVVEFYGLDDFDEYCGELGVKVPNEVGMMICEFPETHCCLNPVLFREGILELMCAESYEELLYNARRLDGEDM